MDTDKDFIDLLFEEMEYSEIILYSFIGNLKTGLDVNIP